MGLFVSIRRRIKFSSDRRHSSCSSVFNESNMKKNCVPILAVLAALALGSCDTPVGAGAGYGAAAGALIGSAIQEDQARYYGPAPAGGYPWAQWSGTPGVVVSPYPPHRLVDVRGIPHGALVRDPSSGGLFRRP